MENITVDNEVYNLDTLQFADITPNYTRYLKGKYQNNLERCKARLIYPIVKELKKYGYDNHIDQILQILQYWNFVEPYTYEDAFKIENNNFRALVFSSIDIRKMIEHLGAKRIKVEGIELINKVFNPHTEKFSEEEYSYIAELHEVDGEKLGITREKLYVVKVWCTSTNQEHWLWVDENNCNISSPLDAVASTCIVYEPMVEKIKYIIRQGDVFLFEMKEPVKLSSKDKKVRLSKEKYYSLLKSQA